ncbi:hypothetical protein [Leifsonia sp. Root227]|uniref:hypothetical protein n=1 Tax=Leifsonia sp. Root227 TaxID=1736496 RepID=UPI0012FAEACF|nr:hypothetical protein [Leifsonia sp. Root227]
MSNVAVAVILLSPAELTIAWIRNGFRRIESAAQDALATADEAKQTANATAQSLADVRNLLVQRQEDDLEEIKDKYRKLAANSSRDTLIDALRSATSDRLITAAGVRSPIWETNLHYRYVIDGDGGELEVRIEEDDGTIVSKHVWDSGEEAAEFYQRLVLAVRDTGEDRGTGLNLPTHSVEELSKILVDVVHLRSQEPMGHRSSLQKIIERVDGWYFTERYVIAAEQLSYTIRIEDLHRMDWEEHLRNRGWYDAAIAIPFARRLYGITKQGSR